MFWGAMTRLKSTDEYVTFNFFLFPFPFDTGSLALDFLPISSVFAFPLRYLLFDDVTLAIYGLSRGLSALLRLSPQQLTERHVHIPDLFPSFPMDMKNRRLDSPDRTIQYELPSPDAVGEKVAVSRIHVPVRENKLTLSVLQVQCPLFNPIAEDRDGQESVGSMVWCFVQYFVCLPPFLVPLHYLSPISFLAR